jgi:hypothetical protein
MMTNTNMYSPNQSKAQGTIEYLIIIAIVVVIALVVISILTGFLSTGTEIDSDSSQIKALAGEFSLTDLAVTTDGNFVLNIKNNLPEITITDINLIDKNNHSFSYSLSQSQKQNFIIYSEETCVEGSKITSNVKITYSTKHGITKTYWLKNIQFECTNYITNNSANDLVNLGGCSETQVEIDETCYTCTQGGVQNVGSFSTLSKGFFTTTTKTSNGIKLISQSNDFSQNNSFSLTSKGYFTNTQKTNQGITIANLPSEFLINNSFSLTSKGYFTNTQKTNYGISLFDSNNDGNFSSFVYHRENNSASKWNIQIDHNADGTNNTISLQTRTATDYNTNDNNLIAHWTMNNQTNNIIQDIKNDNNAVAYNNVTFTDQNGVVGKGATFDGNNFIQIDLPETKTIRSISYWIKSDSSSVRQQSPIKFDDQIVISFNYLSNGHDANYYLNGEEQTLTYGSELLSNPGGESATTTPWSQANCIQYNLTTNGWGGEAWVRTGSYAFGIRSNIDSFRCSLRQYDIATTNNNIYEASVWAAGSTSETLKLEIWDETWYVQNYEEHPILQLDVKPNWKKTNTFFKAVGPNHKLGIYPKGLNQWTQIDDMSLKQVFTEELETNQWTHVVINFSENIDVNTLTIGKGISNFFIGSIDEVRIYDKELSTTEINELYLLGTNFLDWSAWEDLETYDANTQINIEDGNFFQYKTILTTNNDLNSPFLLDYNINSLICE